MGQEPFWIRKCLSVFTAASGKDEIENKLFSEKVFICIYVGWRIHLNELAREKMRDLLASKT